MDLRVGRCFGLIVLVWRVGPVTTVSRLCGCSGQIAAVRVHAAKRGRTQCVEAADLPRASAGGGGDCEVW